ncbi:uncharacterized protein LOC141628040 [Silene latifolia]|uniref:uncharacterized protein LOC141628040 n=1 Tax=Silene latifolia TaxID=37657 RepID=UPI003D7886A6
MRVSETADNPQKQEINRTFNNWLLAMGDGRIETKAAKNETEPTWIEIPKEYIGSNGPLNVETVVERIYPDFQQERFNETYLKERAILTPLNEMADKINTYMASLIQSEEKIYRSCDEVCTSSTESTEQYTDYPTEYLNSLNLQGLPPHELKLKKGQKPRSVTEICGGILAKPRV